LADGKFINTSETTSKVFTKLFEAQILVAMKPATRDGVNPHFRSKYATIDSILGTLYPILETSNLVVNHFPCVYGLMQRITHTESGEYVESYLDFTPFLEQKGPQALAGMITYMRRYMLTSTFLMVTEDDDGETAQGRGRSQTPSVPTPTLPPAPLSPTIGDVLNDLEATKTTQELLAILDKYDEFRKKCSEEYTEMINNKVDTKKRRFQEGR